MAPIHDTDIAEERWSRGGWENYELWEKVEVRLRRQKRLWILATAVMFLSLSAVPIVMDRWPKWTSRAMTRKLAQEINHIKWEAIADRAAYRLRFVGEGHLDFIVEKLAQCSSPAGEIKRTGRLGSEETSNTYSWVSAEQAKNFAIPGIVSEFCYDPLQGNYAFLNGGAVVGFGIISVKDLSESRLDRLSVLLLSGPSAEISFD